MRARCSIAVGIFVPVVLSYFQMRFLLPALQPALVDRHLYALDQALFGTTRPPSGFGS
ncbi:MAG: hypothetical protein IPG17_14760 [Sandaracinaceae bacterium]|nr:hypothetical protein [Sandaracinaceae bacterium]